MKCILCKIRIAKQQIWKTPEERKYCLTCWTVLEMIKTMENALNEELKNKKIDKKIKISLG